MKISKRFKRSALETGALALFLMDLCWWHTRVLAWLAVLYFGWGYFRYRREAVLNFNRSRSIREQMTLSAIRTIEEEYTRRDDYDTFEKRARIRPPLERYFYFGRYRRVQQLLGRYIAGSSRMLDLGCGFGMNTVHAFRTLGVAAVGLELNGMKLTEAVRSCQPHPKPRNLDWVCGQAERPPFRPASFDCILCSEVLEHLLDPPAGLDACRYLLVEGGLLVLTTPSSHNLDHSSNPFIIAEKTASLLWDGVLPPYHNLHAQFEFDWRNPEPAYGIHYHFSRQRLRALLEERGFKTVWSGSYEAEVFPFLLLELLARGNVERIARFADPWENIIESIPVMRHLGQHLLWVAEKVAERPAGST